MKSPLCTFAAAAAFYAQGTLAITDPHCPSTNVCFRWGVPQAAVSSGAGDVYFQIKAPTTHSWVGIGIGSRMAGSEMFIIYQDGSGNVTLSPRVSPGYNMPTYSERSGVQLLSGSGVSNNEMTANIRCSDCSSLNLAGSNSWIAGWKRGSSLASTSPSESITEHDGDTSFSVNFATAAFTTSGNPFTSTTTTTTTTGSGSRVAVSGGGSTNVDKLVRAHGIILSIVFIFAYPIGSVLMPFLGKWFIHAGWQTIAFLLMWAGFGTGYVAARDGGYWWNNTHTKLGTIVCALIGLQPFLGWLHHVYFVKNQQRGVISHVHIWFGRATMIIGIVNGGLGLKLAGSSTAYIAVYSVIASIASILYAMGAIWGQGRRSRNTMSKGINSSEDSVEMSQSRQPVH